MTNAIALNERSVYEWLEAAERGDHAPALPAPSSIEAGATKSLAGAFTWSASGPSDVDRVDYSGVTGPVDQNSVVALGLGFIRRNITQGRVAVGREDGGEYNADERHPLLDVLRRPNPWMSSVEAIENTAEDLVLWGEAYWIKARDGFGDVEELYWRPNYSIEPVDEPDPRRSRVNGPIREYVYTWGGTVERYAPSEVIHFRLKSDRSRPHRGCSDLTAQGRNASAITAAERYQVSILLNAHGGKVAAPKDGEAWDDAQAQGIVNSIKRGISGGKAGEIGRVNFPIDLIDVGMGPEQMALDRITNLPIAMVLAAMGLNPECLDLPSSQATSTYANKGESVRSAYNNAIIPLQGKIADAIEAQCLATDFRRSRADSVWWDRRYVEALKEDASEKADRASTLADIATLNERRALVDLPPVEGGDASPVEVQAEKDAMAAEIAGAAGDDPAEGDPMPEPDPADEDTADE